MLQPLGAKHTVSTEISGWAEKNIGSRVCAWLDTVLANDASSRDRLTSMAEELFKCLDVVVQSGVAHARILEEKITNPERNRKAG